MDSEEKQVSSIKEGGPLPSDTTARETAGDVGGEQTGVTGFLDDMDDPGSLRKKAQDTRVSESQVKDPPQSAPSIPLKIRSNFAESAPIEIVVRDIPTSIKEFMSKTGRTLDRCSRSLEILSWLAMAACMWFSGAKFNAKETQDAIIFVSLALVFLNNGIRMPNSIGGELIKRMTRIVDR